MVKPIKSEEEVKPYVEAILFAADRPVAPAKISRAIEGADVRTVRKCIEQLNQEYAQTGRSFQIEEIAEGYQVLTKPEFWKVVSKIRQTRTESKLSPASLETLAIVAYKQPVLRADIEAIRGVQSGELLRGLLERGLVKVVGRLDTIGRPILYGTTRTFLEQIGLNTIKGLPRMDQLRPQDRPVPSAPPPAEAQAETPQSDETESGPQQPEPAAALEDGPKATDAGQDAPEEATKP
ncbi:MAG: SMC-Scp complex subunit ScpB [Planctomycetota bacterium]